ncbi:MAG: anaerobic ribonucleoside-triphosphate reductase activating protein [Candidatus Anstonellales archaeon]
MRDDELRIAGIERESIVDGVGIRYVIFTQGCKHNCYMCHNKLTHDFNGGQSIKLIDIYNEIKNLDYLDGVTFSGGDPFFQAKNCAKLAKMIKEEININVWAYTGFTFEEIMKYNDKDMLEFMRYIDILVDGRYMHDLRDLSLRFRGSRNQRLIDVKESLKVNKVIEIGL